MEQSLTKDLEKLPEIEYCGRRGQECSFIHFLNLVWQPVLRYVEHLGAGEQVAWTKALQIHHDALVREMKGIVLVASAPLPVNEWIAFIKNTLFEKVGVDVPIRLISEVVSLIAPLQVEPTPANALHLLRSSLCTKLVGASLAAQVNRMILAEVSELPAPLLSQQEMSLGIKADLVATLERLHCKRDDEDDTSPRPAKRLRRDEQSIKDLMKSKTQQALFALENKLCISRTFDTICHANSLVEDIRRASSHKSGDLEAPHLEDVLVGRKALMPHIILLDGAMDRCSSELLFAHRETGSFAGVALATDESPPTQPRFRGLRFQITVMYIGTFAPLSEWESSSAPPISGRCMLGDIVHCPGKKGIDVSRILEKQLARVGLNCYDVVSCTGDGGGENEGSQGVHAYFENLSPGYVRRRCLPHIAWRTADMAIRASSLDYKNLAAYLVEGITWTRLREIATRDPRDGGLQLFRDGSRPCKDIFGCSPAAIITTRPETDLNFLKLLKGKEHTLHKLATRDLEQRTTLGAETTRAIQNLGDIDQRICRAVLCEILQKCMFLWYWNAKHSKVATECSWDELLAKASSTILALEISQEVLERFSYSAEEVEAMDPRPETWVEFAVLSVVGEQSLVPERLRGALDFHRRVTDAASAHLSLLADNIQKSLAGSQAVVSR